ncbi:MAG: ATP-dependent DNA helicase [Proteobacteria bacterium]|nr:ATP-dependent DNA helicase [Pseudomonadota bacterium]
MRPDDIFHRDGPLARALAHYEIRDAQREMAQAVADILDQNGVLLAEAGTGTGKTIAYLAPIIVSGRKTVISTGTRNLQEQIFFKDLGFLQEALGISRRCVYLKGQNNYLCRTRLKQFFTSPKSLAYPAAEVARLQRFAEETTTGDRMEIDGLSDDSAIWNEVCSTRETRIGALCPFFEECFVTRARRMAHSADIVVVNHHLYCADLATRRQGGQILPDHEVVVFDEAHLLEDIATEFFGLRLSSAGIERLMQDVSRVVTAASFAVDSQALPRKRTAAEAVKFAKSFFACFRGAPGRTPLSFDDVAETALPLWHRLDAALESVELSLRLHEGEDAGVDHMAHRILTARNTLGEIVEHRDNSKVYWVENHARSVSLGASLIDVSGVFRESVFFAREAVALVSATLTVNRAFDFVASRLGIDFDVVTRTLPAPFDYARQAALYVPAHMPDPRAPGFLDAAANEIWELVTMSGGGALVLCTSVAAMKHYYQHLVTRYEGPLLLQGEGPKSTLIAQFLASPASVLIATSSFWQGVDIPGDALRLVIIDKLPFTPPGDPVTAARIARIKAQGQEPFRTYQVPLAALQLKQGFGRLIRTAQDWGMVAILDARLRAKGYGRTFLASLPDCPLFDAPEPVRQWWQEQRDATRHHPHLRLLPDH